MRLFTFLKSFCPSPLPAGFVYLADIDPTIIQSVRYAGADNFLGRPVLGYLQAKIILTRPAAEALKNVQQEMTTQGYSLIVYDGYRPQRAVDAWITWSQDPSDQAGKAWYYPSLNKDELFAQGYIAKKSSHSRGSTVDLSIIRVGTQVHPVVPSARKLLDGEEIPFLDDGSVDMGASFDFLHEASHHDSPRVSKNATEKRNFLRRAMKQHGFKDYTPEWWHYTLEEEPFPNTYFNFVVR